jgi:hypothetical protein
MKILDYVIPYNILSEKYCTTFPPGYAHYAADKK